MALIKQAARAARAATSATTAVVGVAARPSQDAALAADLLSTRDLPTGWALQLSDLTLPGYGSRAHAFTLAAMGAGVMMSGRIAAVRKGDLLVVIMALGPEGVPSSVFTSTLSQAVARA